MSRRKKRLVHSSAVGALQIVEADDRDLGRGISPDGPAGHIDGEDRVVEQVKLLQAGQGLAVSGDQKIDHLRFTPCESVTGSSS